MIVYVVCVYLLFFKQKTAYEMRISDWSSDVCSSDLRLLARNIRAGEADRDTRRHVVIQAEVEPPRGADAVEAHGDRNRSEREAVDRKSVVEGKSVLVRVDLGGRRIINKKIN